MTLNINENIVCLSISIFIFSLVLSFIIDLYSLIPLIANANNTGINIIFCKSIDEKINFAPLFAPSVAIMLDILYPRLNPLKHITPYTTNIPITVSPANHRLSASIRLFFMDTIKSSA